VLLDWLIHGEYDTDNISREVISRRQSLQATSVNPAILFRIKLCRFSHGFYLERLHASECRVHAAMKPDTFLRYTLRKCNILPCKI